MPSVTVDSTSQRFTSARQPEPDIFLLHTTEGMSWPGYGGGSSAPHDTVRPIRGKGIEVRRHRDYGDFGKALENDSGGVETNRRGVIQVELRGTCDPKHRNDPAWYYWPDADDAVLEALADYYRPILAHYGIPARAMAEFVAYPASYGERASQRLSWSEWNNGAGICGHQHAPENAHGDPGDFPIERFIAFLTNQEDLDMSAAQTVNDYTRALLLDGYWQEGERKPSILAVLAETQRRVSMTRADVAALTAAVEALAASKSTDPAAIVAEVGAAVRERLAKVSFDVTDAGSAEGAG